MLPNYTGPKNDHAGIHFKDLQSFPVHAALAMLSKRKTDQRFSYPLENMHIYLVF